MSRGPGSADGSASPGSSDGVSLRSLSERTTDDLRRRLRAGEWEPGTKLPGEHALAQAYGVSRATIRTALQALESEGLTTTRHGAGTFATGAPPEIHADLRHLDSMTATIERSGAVARMAYRSREVRGATEVEAERLGIDAGDAVLHTERALTADGQPVAFSYDVLPTASFGPDFDPTTVEGSLYRLLAAAGVEVAWAVSSVHAATGSDIGWGRRPAAALYILLDQVHRSIDDQPIAWSRTYYLEGRFQFSLVRTR
jgi:GntR family transcriptional regulator